MSALTPRLSCAAELVRQDAVLADIGTDHAYLPLFLLKERRIRFAYLTDINEGPLRSAEENARESGFRDLTETRLTDGAGELSGLGITDYTVCGMGGELIADIISKAGHLRDGKIRLILQPMTRQEHLRHYLYSEGFSIERELYSTEGDKCYVCMLASYVGEPKALTPLESYIGAENTEIVNRDLQNDYLKKKLAALRRMIDGKRKSGISDPEADSLADAVAEYIRGE